MLDFNVISKIYEEIIPMVLDLYDETEDILLPRLISSNTYYDIHTGGDNELPLGMVMSQSCYDKDKQDIYNEALPVILIFPEIIDMQLHIWRLIRTYEVEVSFIKLILMHELIHYFQLKDKLYFSTALGPGYDNMTEDANHEVNLFVERDCVFKQRLIINKHLRRDPIIKIFWEMELINLNAGYLYKYKADISEQVEKINNMVKPQ